MVLLTILTLCLKIEELIKEDQAAVAALRAQMKVKAGKVKVAFSFLVLVWSFGGQF